MSDYKPVTVEAARQIATVFEKNVVVVASIDTLHDRLHVTTFGRSAAEKLTAAAYGDKIAEVLASERLAEMVTFEDFRLTGAELHALAADQSAWSQATFGSDEDRGPIGALKHLEKEAKEAYTAMQAVDSDDLESADSVEQMSVILQPVHSELADCFLLILDASRRAGLSPLSLIRAAQSKMVVNKSRTRSKPDGDYPIEHVREAS